MPVADEGIDVLARAELALDVDEARAAGRDRREPVRAPQHVEPRREREALLRQQPGAQVPLALAGDGEVARQHDAFEAGVLARAS